MVLYYSFNHWLEVEGHWYHISKIGNLVLYLVVMSWFIDEMQYQIASTIQFMFVFSSDTSSLTCNGGEAEDGPAECTACSAGYGVTDDGMCASEYFHIILCILAICVLTVLLLSFVENMQDIMHP